MGEKQSRCYRRGVTSPGRLGPSPPCKIVWASSVLETGLHLCKVTGCEAGRGLGGGENHELNGAPGPLTAIPIATERPHNRCFPFPWKRKGSSRGVTMASGQGRSSCPLKAGLWLPASHLSGPRQQTRSRRWPGTDPGKQKEGVCQVDPQRPSRTRQSV